MGTNAKHRQAKVKAAAAGDIRKILGPQVGDDTINRILETEASPGDIQEAFEWLEDDDYMGADLEKPVNSRVRQVHEILTSERNQDGLDER